MKIKNVLNVVVASCLIFFISENSSKSFSCEGWNAGYKMSRMHVYGGFSVGGGITVGSSGPGFGINGGARWQRLDCCLDTGADEAGEASACNFEGMNSQCLNVISYTHCAPIVNVTHT